MIMGHVVDTAFLPVQKTHITTFIAYDIKLANLSERKMYDYDTMIGKLPYNNLCLHYESVYF